MNNTIFHRRRVERFAQLLEEANSRRRHSRSPLDDRLVPYVELGQRVRDAQHPDAATPEEDFRTSLRAMLVATAQREGIGQTAGDAVPVIARVGAGARNRAPAGDAEDVQPPRLRPRRTRGAIIVGLAAGTLALSGMSMASGDALPGDALYPLKRSVEEAQLALSPNEVTKGQMYLTNAQHRAEEATAEQNSPSRVTGALNDMDAQTRSGISLLTWAATKQVTGTLDLIDEWVPNQRQRLLGITAPASAGRVKDSLTLLARIKVRSAMLQAALQCGAKIGPEDDLGPVPAACPVPGSGSVSSRGGSGRSGSTGGTRSQGGTGSPGATGTGGTSTGGNPSLGPSPNGNASPSPSQATNPQLPDSPTASPDHKAVGAVTGLLGGLL